MKMLELVVTFNTPNMPAPEMEDARNRVEAAVCVAAKTAARETAGHFGYDVTVVVRER